MNLHIVAIDVFGAYEGEFSIEIYETEEETINGIIKTVEISKFTEVLEGTDGLSLEDLISRINDHEILYIHHTTHKVQEPQLILHQLAFSGEGGNWVANHREISGVIETLIDVMDDNVEEKDYERCKDENDAEYIERLCFIVNNRDTFDVNYSIDYV